MTQNFLKHFYGLIKHNIFKITAIFILLITNLQAGFALTPLKITGLEFDNSDNIILIKSQGEIKTEKNENDLEINEIQKGFLENPKRAYVDISNAVLTGSSKTYELKNSVFECVKISQFSLNPNIVRAVFTYKNNNAQTGNFNVFANNKAIIIRFTKDLNKTVKNQIIYSNTQDKDRIVFFENASSSLVVPQDTGITDKNKTDTKEYTLQSKFYINSLAQSSDGIMIKGTGFLSLKPSLYLTSPDRMVIDLDDTVLANNLRNKSFFIGNSGVDANGVIKEREIIRLGQNTTNTARIVIQGKDAKNYRAVVSPDLQNIFIAKKTDIINANITDTKSSIKSISKIESDNSNILEFSFTNPVAFSIFEENSNLYLDFNNVQSIQENAAANLLKEYPNAQTVKIALDKLRIVLPLKDKKSNLQVKISPDAKSIQAVIKNQNETKENKEETGLVAKILNKDKSPSISNLYKVVIDAGHGGSDVGATRAGIYEKNITLAIAKMVEKNLNAKGVQTTMTLNTDKTVSLQERCDISNEVEPDLFVSIHVNSSVNEAIFGVETHWWKEDSNDYAKVVHSYLKKNFTSWQTKDRGLFKSKFYVINHTEAPAILIEIGFISNENERNALITQKRQIEIAKSISDGVMDYLKTKDKK